jgi:RHS repeat-associated protein
MFIVGYSFLSGLAFGEEEGIDSCKVTLSSANAIVDRNLQSSMCENHSQVKCYKVLKFKSVNLQPDNVQFSTTRFGFVLQHVISGTREPGKFSILENPYRYSAYYSDSESAMNYCLSRYYLPDIMRFINRDTYDVSNRYAYCSGDPITNIDPSGHMKAPSGDAMQLPGSAHISPAPEEQLEAFKKYSVLLEGVNNVVVHKLPDKIIAYARTTPSLVGKKVERETLAPKKSFEFTGFAANLAELVVNGKVTTLVDFSGNMENGLVQGRDLRAVFLTSVLRSRIPREIEKLVLSILAPNIPIERVIPPEGGLYERKRGQSREKNS